MVNERGQSRTRLCRILHGCLCLIFLAFLLAGCSDDVSIGDNQGKPSGKVSDFSDCGGFNPAKTAIRPGSSQDCLEYQYDGKGVLTLHHIDAGFNCCPGEISADISFEGDTIGIVEKENFGTNGACHCLCLFDIDLRIDDLQPGKYFIRVGELYLSEGDEPLEFEVDLSSSSSGSHCVSRNHYPWLEIQ